MTIKKPSSRITKSKSAGKTKAQVTKRLKQVEYFKRAKAGRGVP